MARARTLARQLEAYVRLRQHLDTYRFLHVLDFDERAVVEFQRLQKLRIRIGAMDLKIASIALANNASVLTRNVLDFDKVTGLRVEDWTQ